MLAESSMVLDAWRPPPPGIIKINVGAKFMKSNDDMMGVAAYGCVVRTSSGCIRECWAGCVPCATEEEDAQLIDFYNALHKAREAGYADIVLEGHCSAVVQMIEKSSLVHDSNYESIYRCFKFEFCFMHVPHVFSCPNAFSSLIFLC